MAIVGPTPQQTISPLMQILLQGASQAGAGFGQGLGAGFAQEEQAKQFASSSNVPLDFARFFVSQDPNIQKSLLDRLEGMTLGAPQTAGLQALQQRSQQQGIPSELMERQEIQPSQMTIPGQQITLGPSKFERQFRQKEKEMFLKETKKAREQFAVDERSADNTIRTIDQMKSLEKEGLTDRSQMMLYNFLGVEHPEALVDPASEEFLKLQQFFLNNLKSIFGGRIAVMEMQNYLKSIPTLFNSPEGRKRIYNDIKLAMQAKKIASKEARNILKRPLESLNPAEFEFMVNEAAAPKIDQLYSKTSFSKDEGFDELEIAKQQARSQGAKYIIDSETGKKIYL